MCSIVDNDVENNANDETIFAEQKDSCKCGSGEIVLRLTLYGSFCRDCFLQRASHKFRSEFGKSRLVRDNENVAVAFSGGKKSTAMVNLIKEGLSKRAQKKLRFNPKLIYILEPKQWESSCTLDIEIVQTLFRLEIPFHIFSLSQLFETHFKPLLTDKDDLESFNQEEFMKKIDFSKFYDLKKSLKQTTSIDSMLIILRKQLLQKICMNLNLSKVLMGDTASQLAVRLISFVSQGRGGHLSYEMEFADERNSDVVFVKPMRAFLDEEVGTLLELKNLKFHKDISRWEVRTIESLTEDFVRKLQAENDKTLSIICRTGEKLTAMKDKEKRDVRKEVCALCEAPVDRNNSKVTANSAVKVSSTITNELKRNVKGAWNDIESLADCTGNMVHGSQSCQNGLGTSSGDENKSCHASSDACCKSAMQTLILKDDVLSSLCYGCQILIKNMNDVNKLPVNVLERVQAKIRRRMMKESIENFILDDEDDLSH